MSPSWLTFQTGKLEPVDFKAVSKDISPPLAFFDSMWPWGHAAVGYLIYSVYQRLGYDTEPRDASVLVLALGTQLPDLIDKPLAWQFGLLSSGRSVGHSLVIFSVAIPLVWLGLRRVGQTTPLKAFMIGYLSHLFADGVYPMLAGEFSELRYLLYPIVPPINYGVVESGFFAVILSMEFGLTGYIEVGMTLVAMIVWYHDGLPGLRLFIPSRLQSCSKLRK